jgi:hypothetical protein
VFSIKDVHNLLKEELMEDFLQDKLISSFTLDQVIGYQDGLFWLELQQMGRAVLPPWN